MDKNLCKINVSCKFYYTRRLSFVSPAMIFFKVLKF